MSKQRFSISSWQELISLLILVAIALITIFAYFTSYYGWLIYLELFSHFQVQYFILALVLLGVLIFLRQKKHVYIGIFCCAILSAQILPWFLIPTQLFSDRQSSDIRVLVANVNTQNVSYDKVLNLTRTEKPNLAVFIEVNRKWQDRLNALNDFLPYSSVESRPYGLGIAVMSDRPLENTQIKFFNTANNATIITQVSVGDTAVTLVATHPFPPVKPSFFASRNKQMDLVSQYVSKIDSRTILAGDLNLTMWSPYYRRFVSQTGLNNTRKGFGILSSWPTANTYQQLPSWLRWFTLILRIPIDHCLISDGLAVNNIYLGDRTDSDHLPLIVDLRVIPLPQD